MGVTEATCRTAGPFARRFRVTDNNRVAARCAR